MNWIEAMEKLSAELPQHSSFSLQVEQWNHRQEDEMAVPEVQVYVSESGRLLPRRHPRGCSSGSDSERESSLRCASDTGLY